MAGYGTDELFAAWLATNGYALPAGAAASAILRQRGSDYIDNLYGPRFSGSPTDGFDQERAWPRTGATAHCSEIPITTIPAAIPRASYYAAYQEATSPGSLSVAVTGSARVKRKKIGQLEKEFFEGSGDTVLDATPLLSSVEGLLAPYLRQGMLGAVFTV